MNNTNRIITPSDSQTVSISRQEIQDEVRLRCSYMFQSLHRPIVGHA